MRIPVSSHEQVDSFGGSDSDSEEEAARALIEKH